MDVIWHKVWRDLAHNWVRTLLVVLSITVGVCALGVVFGARGLMDVHLARENETSLPANLVFRGDSLDERTVEAALREPGVAEAELETAATIRWRLPEETEWRRGVLAARSDYGVQQVSRVDLLEGNWPGERARAQEGCVLAVERQTSQYLDVPLGSSIIVEIGHGERVIIGGVVRKPYVLPPTSDGATFYATSETIARLTGVREPNKLYVRLVPDGARSGGEGVDAVREQVADRLERMGLAVSGFTTLGPEDGVPVDFVNDSFAAMYLILEALGFASLVVSAFLIVNTVNAIIVRQTWQIGVMKACGATSRRVARVYLSTALMYGLLALLPAIPLGAFGAHALAGWLLEVTNIVDTVDFRLSSGAVAIQVVTGLVVPVLAAAVPVSVGARISPHRAISTYGLGGRFGRGPFDRLVGYVHFLPRPVVLSLRNVFRRKGRVALTLSTFALVGVLFIAVVSVRSSLRHSLRVMLDGLAYDVMLISPRHYRVDRLVEVTEGAPGVSRVEVWDHLYAGLSPVPGEAFEVAVYGVPPDSQVFHPRVNAGRSLLPGEGRAIMLCNRIAEQEGIGVGDEVTLTIAGRDSTWTVVGLLSLDISAGSVTNFVPFDTLVKEAGHAGRGNTVVVISDVHDAASQERLVDALSDVYAARRIEWTTLSSAEELCQDLYAAFDMISYLLLTMVFLAAIVGSLGLTGTLSINVAERRREIGVVRAVGAVSRDVFALFVAEGVFLGVLSWLLAAPLSYPGARLLSDAVGMAYFHSPLEFSYSFPSAILWLLIVTLISALASAWPAWRATRVSVREALTYE